MQIIVCKLVHLLSAIGNDAPEPKQCLGHHDCCLSHRGGATKMLRHAGRIMKLTAILILGACLQIHAAGYGQKITLSEKDVPIEKVFKEISRQANYKFLYTSQILRYAQKVTIVVKNVSVEEVLSISLKDQPFSYEIKERTIIIIPKPGYSLVNLLTVDIGIKGRLVNSSGDPIMGATVIVQGTNQSVITNANGEFLLENVMENSVVIITHVQYEALRIAVNGSSVINATMQIKIGSLDELQVIGYGSITKKLATGNIASIKASDIEKQPVSNALFALQGRVPGLFISQATGVPGSAATVRIQGQNSITKGNDPLYVIDGVPYMSQLPTTEPNYLGSILGTAPGSTSNGNPLSYINPLDIESIEILKDADATSIFGSRAANGAILITTKKGKLGATKIDLNIQNGWSKAIQRVNLLNTEQYIEMRHEGKRNDNSTIFVDDYDINGVWDSTEYTDWQNELFGGTAKYINFQASISGGNNNAQYLISSNFHKETTVFPGEFGDTKGSLRFNINSNSSNQKFGYSLSGSFLVDNNSLPRNDLTSTAFTLAPSAPSLYNDDGSLNWAPSPTGNTTWINNFHPLRDIIRTYISQGKNLISSAILSYRVIKGLELKCNLGYNYLQVNEMVLTPLISIAPERRANSTRNATYANNAVSTWIVEPMVTYFRKIKEGRLDFLVGSSIQERRDDGQVIFGSGYNSDEVLKNMKAATSLSVDASTANMYRYNALFGRLNYNWKDRYIVNLGGRRDGSSRFGSSNKFHNFWSVGVAWIFSEEKVIENYLPFLSFGKIRGSYGTTGNDQIGDYLYLNRYSPISVGVPYQNIGSLNIEGLTNSHLQWEETKKAQLGLDLGFLQNRILISASYFSNRSSNQLLEYALPVTTGFSGISSNFPALVRNSGWEFTLSLINLKTTDFKWLSNLNLTLPKNELVSFKDLSTSSYANTLIIGQPITVVKSYHLLGVDPSTGDYHFLDGQNNPTFTPQYETDRISKVNPQPTYYGGFENSLSYKGFQVDVFFQFVKQIGLNYNFGTFQPGRKGNQPTSVLNRWQKFDDISPIQKFHSTTASSFLFVNSSLVDGSYSDASFIRLRNLSISWQLPQPWRDRLRVKNCRIYLQGQNLITISNYEGLDPETMRNGVSAQLPPLKVMTIGLNLGL